jgi:hypothetical protein
VLGRRRGPTGAELGRGDLALRRGRRLLRLRDGGDPRASTGGGPNRRGGERPGGGPAPSDAPSDGSYSSGNPEATPSDDGTYLRGAQAADANGVVRFTTIYPGWYPGRTTHIHCKVHLDRRTVLTTQLYFDDNLTEEIYRKIPPYTEHTVRDTRNDTDSIYADVGLMTTQRAAVGYLAAINLGLDL